ncbi:tripartite tricarboxylate transporter substrate binding protein [Verminephrobacter eiseniae]|nr:tripartite tricarboxylate transporter substrate binding protein [Verminephrobacter eiseniae]MCW5305400.1 tripartite tricarboxylate transporter substrate binding protein [Verminephrobacter eiseniae]MCW8181588.1 tripartite tricarboxylate transporter substrate binding protein [Verminephrobacter eiseniae]
MWTMRCAHRPTPWTTLRVAYRASLRPHPHNLARPRLFPREMKIQGDLMKFGGKHLAILLAACCAVALGFEASAQSDKIIRILVPFSAGGGADSAARAIAKKLQQDLQETVVVENKPGAGGNIAFEQVAASAPDGRTLALATNSLVINPLLYARTRFDAQKSFTPIALLGRSPVLLLGRANFPASTFPELLEYLRLNPGKLAYASCGNGSIHQLAGEALKSGGKIDMLHIPYKGCSSAISDLAGGQVDLGMISLTSAASFLDGKRVKAFATTGGARSQMIPDLQTVASSGLAGYSFDGWYALVAPSGTPAAVVTRLSSAVNRGLTSEEVRKAFAASYIEPTPSTPGDLEKLFAQERVHYSKIIKAGNIKGD